MRQLIFINVAILTMDAALLGIEYASIFVLETVLKGVLYSIKLKIEFAILSRLVKFVTNDTGKQTEVPLHHPSVSYKVTPPGSDKNIPSQNKDDGLKLLKTEQSDVDKIYAHEFEMD